MTEKLLPCPLCGCEDIRYKVHQDHWENWHGSIYCREHYNKTNDDDRCWSMFYARSPNSREEVIEKLIKKWNKRPSNWHTGTPTEDGWYLYAVEVPERNHVEYFTAVFSNGWIGVSDERLEEITKWQKIKETD